MSVPVEIAVKLFRCRNIVEIAGPKIELGIVPVNWFMLRSMYVSSVNGSKALIVPCIVFPERDKYRRVIGKAGGSSPEIWFIFTSKWNKGLDRGLRLLEKWFEAKTRTLSRGSVVRNGGREPESWL